MTTLTLTTKLVITWQTAEDQSNINFVASRVQTLNRMVAQGKTDGVAYPLTDVITQRNFIDEASANEYRDYTIYSATLFGVTTPTFVISPI
jgi:hypothetical protein